MIKCKRCNAIIKDNLEMTEEAIITKVTQIVGLIADEEDNPDAPYEIVTGCVEEEQEDFEIICYQCSRCSAFYTLPEIIEVFKEESRNDEVSSL